MAAVRSLLVSWIGIAQQAIALAFTWVLSMFRAPEAPIQHPSFAPVSDPERVSPPMPTPSVMPPCEVCGAPSTGLRSHDGHWRCLPHKGVTCDVCDRAIPVIAVLPDQPWRCAEHAHG